MILPIFLYAISMTCSKYDPTRGYPLCIKEQEHISLLGQFQAEDECENVIKFFTQTFEYSAPTVRARLFCKDVRKKK